MVNNRLQKLQEMLKNDPHDIFIKYAIGMEYLGLNETEIAKKYFEEVIVADLSNVAAYYQLGKIFENSGDEKNAISVFEKGLAEAKIKNDQRSIREINAALDDLKF